MLTGHYNPKVRTTAGLYFIVQGVAVFGWWLLLLFSPAVRVYFVLGAGSETALLSFWVADVFLLGLGSIAVGLLCWQESRYLMIAAWFVTGSVSYAALYCFAFTMSTDVGWPGVLLMFGTMIWSGVFTVGLT